MDQYGTETRERSCDLVRRVTDILEDGDSTEVVSIAALHLLVAMFCASSGISSDLSAQISFDCADDVFAAVAKHCIAATQLPVERN